MQVHSYDSAFENPYIALLVGAAVSLDVIALTFSSSHIYSAGYPVWRKWALYNAGWHAGLLLFYLAVIDIVAVASQFLGVLISLPLPDWLEFLEPAWNWLSDRFRGHLVILAALFAMGFVWWQYTFKVVGVPTQPVVEEAPPFLRPLFRRLKPSAVDKGSSWFWHLSACLVAVDMLALAAVIKSGEKLIQFPEGFTKVEGSFRELWEKILASLDYSYAFYTAFICLSVFVVVGILCFCSSFFSNTFWTRVLDKDVENDRSAEAFVIVVMLRLLEPLVIFYFIIHSMAFLATGIPIHSPSFLLGSGLLLAGLIQYVGFHNIIASAKLQASAPLRSATS